jgi:hypothetical protein
MLVLIFYTAFVWNISHSKKNWAKCDNQCMLLFMYSIRYSCQILMKLEFFSTDFKKNIQITYRSVRWDPSCSVRTNRRADMRKLIFVFRYFEKRLKFCVVYLEYNQGFLRMLEHGAAIMLFRIKWSAFITETECVYSAVWIDL